MWPEQDFDKLLKVRLDELAEPSRTDLFNDYLTARKYVVDEVVGNIPRTEPNLTDHSEKHLADVMKQALNLIGPDTSYLTPHELYLLGICILFHDVGNLHGRKKHSDNIADIYHAARSSAFRFNAERLAVLDIAGAHAGCTKTGGHDTIKELGTYSLNGARIRGQELAALLRFGDELAEGPHRTSAYLLNHQLYTPDTRVFHEYAASAEYFIDREKGRIALTYTINLMVRDGELFAGEGIDLAAMLEFCYFRILKLDQERKYCKFYGNTLSAFKETSACFHFFYKGHRLDLTLEPILLSDVSLPNDPAKSIGERFPIYEVSRIGIDLQSLCLRSDENAG